MFGKIKAVSHGRASQFQTSCLSLTDSFFNGEIMKISDRVISKTFRNILQNYYPQLGRNKSYWKFLGYLMFGSLTDEKSGKLVIPSKTLATLEGKKKEFKDRNYLASDFLERFCKDVHSFKYSKWSYMEGLARIVTENEWSQGIKEAIEAERNKEWKNEDQVYISTGAKFTKKSQYQKRQEDKTEALELMSEAGCPEAKDLLNYMNNLNPEIFQNKVLQNIFSAFEVARTLPNGKADRQIDLLNAVVIDCQPYYQPSKATVRIFPYNENLLGLKKEVRKTLTTGWLECDLKSAQLAICAKTWDVPEVQQFLMEGGSIWNSLFEHFDLVKDDEIKAILKEALYATMFGAGARKLDEILKPLGSGSLSKFLSHVVVNAMWKARKEQLELIKENNGAVNCFEQFLSRKQFKMKSILAQLAQSYELALLYPVLQLAKETKRFQIVLWQHDGFSVHITKKSDQERIIRLMKRAVQYQARKLGIITELEVDLNTNYTIVAKSKLGQINNRHTLIQDNNTNWQIQNIYKHL